MKKNILRTKCRNLTEAVEIAEAEEAIEADPNAGTTDPGPKGTKTRTGDTRAGESSRGHGLGEGETTLEDATSRGTGTGPGTGTNPDHASQIPGEGTITGDATPDPGETRMKEDAAVDLSLGARGPRRKRKRTTTTI